jgi:hypothetical protein
VDTLGRQWVNSSANVALAASAAAVTTTAAAVVASALANRRSMEIQNVGNREIFIGDSGVTASTGLRIPSGASYQMEVGSNVVVYALTSTSTSALRVLELA